MKIIEIIKKNKLLVLVAAIYGILFVVAPEKAMKSVNGSLYYLIEMFEVLPLIFLLTVVIEASIPKEVIMNKFGDKSGFVGNLLSLLLGSISAGPIYAAFPISKMLLSKGASVTNIMIILSSWAVIKVPMLANEAKFLGVNFMLARWFLTVIAIFIMAYIVGKLVKKEAILATNRECLTSHEVRVKAEYCMGCGLCVRMAPECFEMRGGKAYLKEGIDTGKFNERLSQSAWKCPAKAIAYNGEVYGDCIN